MFDTSYPLPMDAIALSLRSDGRLQVYLPGLNSDGHTIAVSPDANGMRAIVTILQERLKLPEQKRTISGEMYSPTQQIVDQWLRQNSLTRPAQDSKPKSRKVSSAVLANLNINDLIPKGGDRDE